MLYRKLNLGKILYIVMYFQGFCNLDLEMVVGHVKNKIGRSKYFLFAVT